MRDRVARVPQDGRVIDVTELQVWALIVVFAGVMFSVLSWQTVSFNRTIRTEVGRLDQKLDVKIDALDAKMATRIDHLDRDIHFLMRREFGEPTES